MRVSIAISCLLALSLASCTTQHTSSTANQNGPEISLVKKHNGKNDGRSMAKATVLYDVSPSGFVSNVRILESSPSGLFDREIIAAVKKWKFDGGKMFTETQKKELYIYYKKQ